MKLILITGATGFLGRHLVEQLRSAEPEAALRVLARGATSWGEDARVEVMSGDVTRAEDVLRAAKGVSEIYHLAGMVSRDPKTQAILYRTHIEGTRNVCAAIRRENVHKAVLVSSSGTVAVGPEPVIHDESSGFKNGVVGEWPYYLSKIFAEKLALDYTRRYALPAAIVNPSLILGPGDVHQSSTGDIALFLEGQILALPSGGLNFVDVRDVAAGLIAAMRNGRPGERYLLGGVNWTFRELIENVARIAGRRAPQLQLPLGLSRISARGLRWAFPLAGKSFKLDDASIKMSALFWYCDSSKAWRELGFQTREPAETLRETIGDLRRRPRL